MRAFFEYLVATVVGSFVVFAGFIGYLHFSAPMEQTPTGIATITPDILGKATEATEQSYEIFETYVGDSEEQINDYIFDQEIRSKLILTNVAESDSFVLFDNVNLEKLEGNTKAKSAVRLELGGRVFSAISDVDGTFNIVLPKSLPPFMAAELTTLDENKEELNRKDFTLVLRKYLNRQYFLAENNDKVFSLDAKGYTSLPTDINILSNEQCYAELRPYSEQQKEDNILILPQSVEGLETNTNGFVSFEITNLNEFYSLDYCLDEWEQIGKTFRWHNAVLK